MRNARAQRNNTANELSYHPPALNIQKTSLPGVLLIEPQVRGDDRGFFMETYRVDAFREAGITDVFVQDNHSRSARGFCALEDGSDLVYKCTTLYDASSDRAILWNDPEIGIDWPIGEPVLS